MVELNREVLDLKEKLGIDESYINRLMDYIVDGKGEVSQDDKVKFIIFALEAQKLSPETTAAIINSIMNFSDAEFETLLNDNDRMNMLLSIQYYPESTLDFLFELVTNFVKIEFVKELEQEIAKEMNEKANNF